MCYKLLKCDNLSKRGFFSKKLFKINAFGIDFVFKLPPFPYLCNPLFWAYCLLLLQCGHESVIVIVNL